MKYICGRRSSRLAGECFRLLGYVSTGGMLALVLGGAPVALEVVSREAVSREVVSREVICESRPIFSASRPPAGDHGGATYGTLSNPPPRTENPRAQRVITALAK